jgi:hypothetical protein
VTLVVERVGREGVAGWLAPGVVGRLAVADALDAAIDADDVPAALAGATAGREARGGKGAYGLE